MWSLLKFIKKNLSYAIPISMIMGLVTGYFFKVDFFKYSILPLTISMIYPITVTINIKKVLSKCSLKVQGLTQLVNFLIIPMAGYTIGLIFFSSNPLLAIGLMIISLLPTSGMTISWTNFAKGNTNVAIKMTFIGLTFGAVFFPIYMKFLIGKSIDLPLLKIFKQMIIVIFIPLILGFTTQKLMIKTKGDLYFQNSIKPKFPLLASLAVILILFVATALKAKTILKNPYIILKLILPLILFYLFNYFITIIIGKLFLNRENSISLIYGSVMRNLSVALALAMNVFSNYGFEIALIIAMAYIIQVQSAAGFLKLIDRLFGKANVK